MTLPGWKSCLPIDPLPALLAGDDPARIYFVRRDLLGEAVPPVGTLWELPEPVRLARSQAADGSWHHPGQGDVTTHGTNYALLETYRNLRVLVGMYGYDGSSPAVQRAAEYVCSCQIENGEIRGILGNQSMPYYHGGLLTVLIQAGYAKDKRVRQGLDWLLSVRQADGGWLVPAQAVPARQKTPAFWVGPTFVPDRSLPASHLATDMALRALAAHPDDRACPEARRAGAWLKGRLFLADRYADRQGPEYWLKFQYPFWWPSLVASLDSLSRLGFDRADPEIARGLDWFSEHQSTDGLWPTGYDSGRNAARLRSWVGLAICRMLKRFWE